LHTDALLRLCDHIQFGKVDPTSFDAHWNNTPSSVDIRRIEVRLQVTICTPASAEPTPRMYRTLKRGGAGAVIAARGGGARPAGKAIELDTR
jgi:hypothetical protein